MKIFNHVTEYAEDGKQPTYERLTKEDVKMFLNVLLQRLENDRENISFELKITDNQFLQVHKIASVI